MKALVQARYGWPTDVLDLEDEPEPSVGEHDVLIRVEAASVNAADWHLVRGLPLFVRAGMGLRRPRQTRVGSDAAGRVEAVGRAVTRFAPGDDVVAWGVGAFAELMVTSEEHVVRRPEGLDAVAAATIPLAGTTALQGLRDKARVGEGSRVLVTGASGGVGSFAVQLAVRAGATVTASCSTGNVDMVRSLGAERALDYTRDRVPGPGPFDTVLHLAGPTSVREMFRSLTPQGSLVMANGEGGRWLGPLPAMGRAAARSAVSSRRAACYVARTTRDDVQELVDLAAAGTLRTVIGRTYDLSQAAEAVAHVAEGHPRGKVVVTV
ncbi:NAD(P)-dependent alcohol dehydrogenase [Aquipuribacter sp. MA13-6]|uniref:NAD(P)-dependent alcohol dehydrogenase n=1 Tax=unclassified Aquipuribacter TaxID=2635084 RepID=UPI003EEAD1CB